MITSAIISIALIAPGQSTPLTQQPGRVSIQQYIVDTGNGGGPDLGKADIKCTSTKGGRTDCVIRWPA